MTLREAIVKVLKMNGNPMTTKDIAESLNKNKWYQKKDTSKIASFQIHGRVKNYPRLFCLNGSLVSLPAYAIVSPPKTKTIKLRKPRSSKSINRDEQYVLDLCDRVLGLTSVRQHKFDFLRGDTNKKSRAVQLPVDAYYKELALVIEYRERQHTEKVTFFDKPDRVTVSAVHRGAQRQIYDERRRTLIPKNNLTLIEISYSDFEFDSQKRIIRNQSSHEKVIRKILRPVVRTF